MAERFSGLLIVPRSAQTRNRGPVEYLLRDSLPLLDE
jgi:hypothetical protein